ncbi:hypothetical protein ACFLSV_03390 [Bacteroidota bacterium]
MDTKQAELEITLIKKIMQDSRKIIVFDGKGFIIWGVLILIGLIGTYISIMMEVSYYVFWLWIIVIGIGWIYNLVTHWIIGSKVRVRTFAGKILGGVWLSCGIAMTLIGFLGTYSGALRGWGISPMMSIILGIAYFVSGIIYGHPWAKCLSFGWWGGAIVMFLFPGLHILLIFAVMMIMFLITPGILFYVKWKKELKEND